MEYWNSEMLISKVLTQHSITPLLHYSTTPITQNLFIRME